MKAFLEGGENTIEGTITAMSSHGYLASWKRRQIDVFYGQLIGETGKLSPTSSPITWFLIPLSRAMSGRLIRGSEDAVLNI
jgi:hypothetical protein